MDKAAIGSRLRKARNKAKLTQEQLAEKVDISTTYISDIERGAKFPSLSLFIKLVNALDASADFILSGEIEAGKNCVYDDITKKLDTLTPKQRLGIVDLIDAYIKNLN
ncbi:MAG: helix-turn-helix transcriptional regulator [Ruminococcaceae bacterium]|nr:helix-turn-helix transcriptional regulator [Oscillospiraceae bacterium]